MTLNHVLCLAPEWSTEDHRRADLFTGGRSQVEVRSLRGEVPGGSWLSRKWEGLRGTREVALPRGMWGGKWKGNASGR